MHQKKVLRISAAALVFAVTLRLVGNGFFRPVSAFLTRPETLSFLIYAQTGRVLRPVVHRPIPEPTNSTTPTQITQQSEPTETVPDAVLSFSDGDLELVEVYYYCDYDPDLQILLSSPLNIKLAGEEPTVLIVHSHGSESYSGDYKEVEPYRSLDPDLNMIAIGTEVERILEDTLEKLSLYHGLVAPGTDAGAWAVPHGSDTETALLQRAGIGEARLKVGIEAIQERFVV